MIAKDELIAKDWVFEREFEAQWHFTRGNVWSDVYYGAFLTYHSDTAETKIVTVDEGQNRDGPNHSTKFHGVCYDITTFDLIMTLVDGLNLHKLQKLQKLNQQK